MFVIGTCLCFHSTSVCIMQTLRVTLYHRQKLYYCFLSSLFLKGWRDFLWAIYHASLSSKHTPCTMVTLRYQKVDGIILCSWIITSSFSLLIVKVFRWWGDKTHKVSRLSFVSWRWVDGFLKIQVFWCVLPHQLVCSTDISEECNAFMYRVILVPQLVLICIQLATFMLI